jgi:acyl-CoA thioesterase FadM
MRFYVAPYEIHFDDTMAYGSHHFMTNFRFQCAAREGLLFSDALYRDPAFREDFDRVILYTAEAYSRNLGPANLGDRLVVLLSVEERTTIGLRFCFRVLNERGQPVSVGFQSVLCASREGMIVAFPPSFEAAFDRVAEIIEAPGPLSFRDAVLRGGKAARDLFPDAVRRFAQAQPITAKGVISLDDAPAALPDAAASGDRQPTLVVAAAPAPVALPAAHTALLLGGQGTFDPAHLGRLVAAAPEAADDLRAVADAVRARLGLDVAGLLAGDPALVHPDLDQVGIFLSGVLGARRHAADAPGLVIGHSFGELAALVVGGVWTIDQGAAAVCERILALRGSEGLGGLAAVGADDATTRALITDETTLTVAGRNHDRQTVVAGPADALDRLATAAGARGVPVTLVPSRYPFHHP